MHGVLVLRFVYVCLIVGHWLFTFVNKSAGIVKFDGFVRLNAHYVYRDKETLREKNHIFVMRL